jgi:hypothetical protein
MTESHQTSNKKESVSTIALNNIRALYNKMNTADNLDDLGECLEKTEPEFEVIDECVALSKQKQNTATLNTKALLGLQNLLRPVIESNQFEKVPQDLKDSLQGILNYCESIVLNKCRSDSELKDFDLNETTILLSKYKEQLSSCDDLVDATEIFDACTPLLELIDEKFESLGNMITKRFDIINLIITIQSVIKSILITDDILALIDDDTAKKLYFVKDYQLSVTNQQQ